MRDKIGTEGYFFYFWPDIMETILHFDKMLFRLINRSWQNPLFDSLLPIIRNSATWVPLYLFLLIFGLLNFKKNVWIWVVFAASTAILCDFVSSDIIKETFYRLRPCHHPGLAILRVGYCGQNSSFTSSHATNHFGMAIFFFLTLKDYIHKWGYLFFAWAAIIIYAQVYVGVHYPLDVICGGMVGTCLGLITATAFNRVFGLERI